jgi:hypothetical protein
MNDYQGHRNSTSCTGEDRPEHPRMVLDTREETSAPQLKRRQIEWNRVNHLDANEPFVLRMQSSHSSKRPQRRHLLDDRAKSRDRCIHSPQQIRERNDYTSTMRNDIQIVSLHHVPSTHEHLGTGTEHLCLLIIKLRIVVFPATEINHSVVVYLTSARLPSTSTRNR